MDRVSRLGTALALAQGLWVRGRIDVLPPAAGPSRGVEGDTNDREPLRIGVLGESTAAGYGVDTHRAGFTGAMARILAATSGRAVHWHVAGEHGATARRIRFRLLPQLDGGYDVVVLLAGANDVLARRTPGQWGEDLTAIVEHLGERTRDVVVTGVPPFECFPSLPRNLGRYLAVRGRELDRVTRQVCDATAYAHFAEVDWDMVDETYFARDGFHPGAIGYLRWAEGVAAVVPVQ